MHLIRLDDRAVYRWNSQELAAYHVDLSMHKDDFNELGIAGKIKVTIEVYEE